PLHLPLPRHTTSDSLSTHLAAALLPSPQTAAALFSPAPPHCCYNSFPLLLSHLSLRSCSFFFPNLAAAALFSPKLLLLLLPCAPLLNLCSEPPPSAAPFVCVCVIHEKHIVVLSEQLVLRLVQLQTVLC
uniref:Uncharacterized protein n=1 Tax=Aegilops tauschii subsp. strangulata TaxID=200361 RepID=A0A453BJW1_AEGTS